jgi:hypothetical protein
MTTANWSAPRHRIPSAIAAALISVLVLGSVASLFMTEETPSAGVTVAVAKL